jgi:hypothetical protein
MVLNNKIRIISGLGFLLSLVLCFSCEKSFPGMINCSECSDNEPIRINLKLKFSAHYYHIDIKLDIFEGNVEDSVIYQSFSTVKTSTTISVPKNKHYSLVAKYYLPEGTFLVINSVFPTVKYDETECEKVCYYVVGNVVDLRLRYPKASKNL